MSVLLRDERVPLAGSLRTAAQLVLHELPAVLVASLITAASWMPLALVVLARAGAFLPFALLVAALGCSGLVRAVAPVADGGRVRWRGFLRVDAIWVALSVIVGTLVCVAAVAPRAPLIAVAAVVAAGGAIVLPLAAAYGAVRDRHGLAALRGAGIIAVVRPSAALCVAAIGVVGAFGVVASAGVLVLVLPALHAVYTALVVRSVVDIVNGRSDS